MKFAESNFKFFIGKWNERIDQGWSHTGNTKSNDCGMCDGKLEFINWLFSGNAG